jgi:hypothetical protein
MSRRFFTNIDLVGNQLLNAVNVALVTAVNQFIVDIAGVVPPIIVLSRRGGTPSAGYGTQQTWQLRSSTTNDQDAAYQVVRWTNATHATRSAAYALAVAKAGVLQERLVLPHTSYAAGIYVPWLTGDTLGAAYFGSTNAANTTTVLTAATASGTALRALASGAGTGLATQVASGIGADITSQTGLPLQVTQLGSSGTSDVGDLAVFDRRGRAPTSGFGAAQRWRLASTDFSLDAALDVTDWIDPTDATATARRRIQLIRNGMLGDALVVDGTDSATQTGLLLLHDGTLKRVKVGAADSGGVGQRLLTIDN